MFKPSEIGTKDGTSSDALLRQLQFKHEVGVRGADVHEHERLGVATQAVAHQHGKLVVPVQ
eukprot:365942-Chlamydomonas_euryale.AAC.44